MFLKFHPDKWQKCSALSLIHISNGGNVQWNHIWLLWGVGIISALLVFLAAKNDYRKTYIASYQESNGLLELLDLKSKKTLQLPHHRHLEFLYHYPLNSSQDELLVDPNIILST